MNTWIVLNHRGCLQARPYSMFPSTVYSRRIYLLVENHLVIKSIAFRTCLHRQCKTADPVCIIRVVHDPRTRLQHKTSLMTTSTVKNRRSCLQQKTSVITTHLLSIERADWPKLHDMFKAGDVKAWQREFPAGFTVTVWASNLLLIKEVFSLEKLHSHWGAHAIFPAKNRTN